MSESIEIELSVSIESISIEMKVSNQHRDIYLDINDTRIIVHKGKVDNQFPLGSVVITKDKLMSYWVSELEMVIQPTIKLGNIIFPVIEEWQD